MSDQRNVDRLRLGLCLYSIGIVVCLYFLVDAWIYMNEICYPLINFLLAGSLMAIFALRLAILGTRAFNERKRP
jgi:hypothetical protein